MAQNTHSGPEVAVEEQPHDHEDLAAITADRVATYLADPSPDALLDLVECTKSLVGTRFSERNQLMLELQYAARDCDWEHPPEYFHGYNTWQNDYGRQVQQGESGFTIIIPKQTSYRACPTCGKSPDWHVDHPDRCQTDDGICPRAGRNPDTWDCDPDDWTPNTYFGTGTVFELQQTEPIDDYDGEPFTRPSVTPPAAVSPDRLFTLLRDEYEAGTVINDPPAGFEPAVYTTRHAQIGQKGATTTTGHIEVTENASADQFSTLVHEIAHNYLDHSATPSFPQSTATSSRAHQEVEAELTAKLVLDHFGFDSDKADIYIEAWLDYHHNAVTTTAQTVDEPVIEHVTERIHSIRTAVSDIVGAIEAARGTQLD